MSTQPSDTELLYRSILAVLHKQPNVAVLGAQILALSTTMYHLKDKWPEWCTFVSQTLPEQIFQHVHDMEEDPMPYTEELVV